MRKMLRSSLMQRILWTILILFIYMLGKYTPISTYPNQLSQDQTALEMTLNSFAMVTGGEFSKLNLFSLGLSPWMTSMILWRFVGFLKLNAAFTQLQNHLSQTFIMLVVGIIQAFGYLAVMPATSVSNYERLGTIVILIAGTFVLMWLGQLNTEKGLGGSSTIIAASMILSFIMSISAMTDGRLITPALVTLFVIVTLVLVWIAVVVNKAEYRIPTRRIMLNNNLLKSSYIPIRVTPAGGMPFMYAMTLMTLPVLLLQGLIAVVPQLAGLRGLEGRLSVSELPGILLYTGVLFILSYGFAYFNMDPSEVAESMQKSGDYIENIRPGKATQVYLTRYLNRMAFVGAVYTCMMGSLPLFLVWYFNGETGLGMMVNNIYIVTTLMLTIVEQVDIIQSWKQYEDII
ncbi:accessory Sec system protein translocase subunit SecY2 [Streptococcus suis]